MRVLPRGGALLAAGRLGGDVMTPWERFMLWSVFVLAVSRAVGFALDQLLARRRGPIDYEAIRPSEN